MNGPNPNPNAANTGGGQIKSNQMEPRKKKQIKSKSNPGPKVAARGKPRHLAVLTVLALRTSKIEGPDRRHIDIPNP
jgi:hypothetical protein